MRYAKQNITKEVIFILVGFFILLSSGCKKEPVDYDAPSIEWIIDDGFVYSDTTLLLSDSILIGFKAETRSEVELTHFNTTIIKDTTTVSIDTALFTSKFEYQKQIVKGIAEVEVWSFYVRDRDGRKSDILTLTLHLDSLSIFTGINFVPSLKLGAQNNLETGAFYSFAGDQVYHLEQAFAHQEEINLLYFFDTVEGDANTIASPGANIDKLLFPGESGISNWVLKNTTRFNQQKNISLEEFDLCRNDSLILANTFEFSNGKRKAKNLSVGHIYSFRTEDGLAGLFKVLSVLDEETGSIEIAIKSLK